MVCEIRGQGSGRITAEYTDHREGRSGYLSPWPRTPVFADYDVAGQVRGSSPPESTSWPATA